MNLNLENKIISAICENDTQFITQKLEEININSRLQSEDNDTLLLYAIGNPDNEIFDLLIKNGADLNAKNNLGENILHAAIYSGKIDRVKKIFSKKNIDKKSEDGSTPLILSLLLGHETIANFLIDMEANFNLADNEGNEPIHLAAFFGFKTVVQRLIEKNCQLFKKTKKGNLPLALAVNENHKEIVKILYTQMYNN